LNLWEKKKWGKKKGTMTEKKGGKATFLLYIEKGEVKKGEVFTKKGGKKRERCLDASRGQKVFLERRKKLESADLAKKGGEFAHALNEKTTYKSGSVM